MTSWMASEGGHVAGGNGSSVEVDRKTGGGKEMDDLQKKLEEMMEENGELAEEVATLAREVCRLRREKDLSLREEERLNLEVAFLEEEKEYYQNQVDDTRKILFELKEEMEKAVAEATKCKSHLVLSELDRSHEIDGYLEEIAQLTDDKSHVARIIKYGLPLKVGNLRHSLVRTEEFLAQKADSKRLHSELNKASARIISQDSYIADLERSVQELAQMLCRFHPMPTPASILAAASGSATSSSSSSSTFSSAVEREALHSRRDVVRRHHDMTPFFDQ